MQHIHHNLRFLHAFITEAHQDNSDGKKNLILI